MLERLHGYLINLLPATFTTVVVTLLSFTLATLIGIVLAAMRLSRFRIVRLFAMVYTELFRNTPLLVQVFFIFYVVPSYVPIANLNPLTVGCLALGLYFGAYLGETFRGGILGVDKRQWEAGRVLQLSNVTIFTRVILPQAFRSVVPAWGNILVGSFKATAVLSIITLNELMFQARILGSLTFRYFEIFTVATALYFAIGYPTIRAINWLERRLSLETTTEVTKFQVDKRAIELAGR